MFELASAWKTLGVSDLAEATGGVKRTEEVRLIALSSTVQFRGAKSPPTTVYTDIICFQTSNTTCTHVKNLEGAEIIIHDI